jgi:hypothetical protein
MSFALGCPLYNSVRFLPKYFESILALDYPKKEIHLKFVITKCNDSTEEWVRDFIKDHGSEYGSTEVRVREKVKGESHLLTKILNVADAWDILSQMSKPYDLMVIEHDNTVPPDSVKRLLKMVEMGADMCSGLTLMMGGNASYQLADGSVFRVTGMPTFSAYSNAYMNQPIKDEFGRPAVLQIGRQTPSFQVIYLPKVLANRIIKVGAIATGMVYLTRRIMDAIKFECMPDSSQDLVFCQKAYALGFKLLVDTGLWYEHHHYSYFKWVDGDGRIVVYLRGQNLDDLTVPGSNLPLETLMAMIIPKEEVERQGKRPGALIANTVEWKVDDS